MNMQTLKGDIYGGLTAAVVALPLALAFGVSSGFGAIAGLYGAIFVGFFSALFGGTPAQVSGPTGPMTVVMALIFTQTAGYFSDSPEQAIAVAFSIVMLGGAFQIAFGYLKIGRFINLIPLPVISGFMTGIGVIIVLLQLAPLVGADNASSPLQAVLSIPSYLETLHGPTLLLSGLTLAIVFLLPKSVNRILPAPLVALIVGTIIVVLALPSGSVSQLGEIPSGFPAIQWPVFDVSLMVYMLKSALMLAVLGSLDSLLTSLVADNLTRTNHNSDQELIGQGVGNMIAGLFGGLPGAGATMRTVVNIRAGGQSKVAGMVHALVLLVIVLGAGGLAEKIPHAVLAGILIKVGIDIIDWGYLRLMLKAPKAGVFMMLTVLVLTVFVDLITAVGVGVVMASLVLLSRISNLQLANISHSKTDALQLNDHEQRLLSEHEDEILLFCLGGAINFGAAKGVVQKFTSISNYQLVILDFDQVVFLDYSATMAVAQMLERAKAAQKHILVCGLSSEVAATLDNLNVLDLLLAQDRLANRAQALQRANELLASSSEND